MGEVVLGSLWLYQYSHEHCHCPSHTPLLARLPRPKQSYVRSMSNRCPPSGKTRQGSVYSATRQLAPHDDSILLVHYFCCIASRNSAFIIYKTSILLLDTGPDCFLLFDQVVLQLEPSPSAPIILNCPFAYHHSRNERAKLNADPATLSRSVAVHGSCALALEPTPEQHNCSRSHISWRDGIEQEAFCIYMTLFTLFTPGGPREGNPALKL
jgi:hypothetical protein